MKPPWKAYVDLYRAVREGQPKPIMTEPPPRDARPEVWKKWANEQLDAIGDDLISGWVKAIEAQDREGRGGFEDYINLAEHGCIEPLRELLPTLARNPVQAEHLKYIAERFLNLPKRFGKGDKWPERVDEVAGAVDDVKRLRGLLGRLRPKYVSLEEIAAERHYIDPEKIINRMGRGKLRTKS